MAEFGTEDYLALKEQYDNLKSEYDIVTEEVKAMDADIKAKDEKIANMSNLLYESLITRDKPKGSDAPAKKDFDTLLREAFNKQ